METVRFVKYHALGNDYLVIDPSGGLRELAPAEVVRVCHRNFGVGSDGVLWGPMGPGEGGRPFALRIYNPDGSIAEKSGNGLRIFSRYLWDQRLVRAGVPFKVFTDGGVVTSEVAPGGRSVAVEMGRVTFAGDAIPVAGGARDVLEEQMEVAGERLVFSAASIGNPHCVILQDKVSESEARRLGPLIEVEPRFPNRTNVQFVQVIDPGNLRIEIWERGAGYTLASGSSSSAAAAVAHRLGHCGPEVTVHMPGGRLEIRIADGFEVTMTGAVTRVAEGAIDPEVFS
jgi:diaminopimelate epimerase